MVEIMKQQEDGTIKASGVEICNDCNSKVSIMDIIYGISVAHTLEKFLDLLCLDCRPRVEILSSK